NVSSLMLSRSIARRGEIVVRIALGATPARIVRQLLTESGVIGIASGAFGVVLAWAGIDAIVMGFAPAVPHAHRACLDSRALLFALGVSLVTAVAFGFAPAIGASRWSLHSALIESGARATTSKRANAARGALIAVEIAMALVLLVGAITIAKSFLRLV